MVPMRIAHITDPHIRHAIPGPSSHPERRARESAGLLTLALADARARGADVIALTGDVVDVPPHLFSPDRASATGIEAEAGSATGNPADAALWRAVREDYRWVRAQLDACGLPWVALPGNHDAIDLMRQELCDQDADVTIEGADGLRVRLLSFWDREHDLHVPRRVLGERRRLDAALTDPDPTPQVHLQHYAIAPQFGLDYPLNYLEADELRARIVGSGRVALSLSGHHHPGAEPEWHGQEGDGATGGTGAGGVADDAGTRGERATGEAGATAEGATDEAGAGPDGRVVSSPGTLFSVTPALTEAPHPYRLFDITTEADGSRTMGWEQVDLDPDPAARPAVFLDRDGCINTLAAYYTGPEAMELLPHTSHAIRRLREGGYRIVVITNQTCVGLGYVTPELLNEVHERMHGLLEAEGGGPDAIDAIYASLDAGDNAVADRFRDTALPHKPDPTMILRAAQTLHVDLGRSFMVGDSLADVGVGRNAGVTPILVRTGNGRRTEEKLEGDQLVSEAPPLVVDTLAHAATAILGDAGRRD
jgi:histidinol-phosphate phosphatase family protein